MGRVDLLIRVFISAVYIGLFLFGYVLTASRERWKVITGWAIMSVLVLVLLGVFGFIIANYDRFN